MRDVKELVERIEALLPKVTPGEWRADVAETVSGVTGGPGGFYVAMCTENTPEFKANTEYFAATQPSVIRALLTERASLLAQVEKAGEVIAQTKNGIDAVIKEESDSGAACGWTPCSGCHETVDGHPVGHYPHSDLFGCLLGSGCSECGGLGVVWNYYDKSSLALMAEEFAPVSQPTPAEDAFESIRKILINELNEPVRQAFWIAVKARDDLRAARQWMETKSHD